MNFKMDYDTDLFTLNVSFNAYPARPARISGPPDNWDPGELPEIEILSVKIDRTNIDILSHLYDPELEKMEDACMDYAEEQWANMSSEKY